MELELKRDKLGARATLGHLFVDGAYECETLEDVYRPPPLPKVPHFTCIPCGRYEVVITYSPRFKLDMPLLLNVPDFKGVRIHPGNNAIDTDGCLLVGKERVGDTILHSRDAYAALFQKIDAARARGELVHITITIEKEKSHERPEQPHSKPNPQP